MRRVVPIVALVFSMVLAPLSQARAQTPATPQVAPSPQAGSILLTVFLRHDQSKTLGEINQALEQHGYYDKFPPKGIEVVSWYIMMGVGQVVTLRVPAERLREVNRALEETAWGAYRTEFYPTYDYKSVWEADQKRRGK